MRRRSRASSKLANARSRKAKTVKAARHRSSSAFGQETEVARLTRELHDAPFFRDAGSMRRRLKLDVTRSATTTNVRMRSEASV